MSARMPFRTMTLLAAALLGTANYSPANAQQPGQRVGGQPAANGQQQAAGGRQPGQVPQAVEPGRPFPPLATAAQQRLDQLLAKWEAESKNTKLMACEFTRWHYDSKLAPAGVHATWARGEIRYAAPDKGVFRVDELQFYKGMDGQKPNFGPDPKQQGEYWVCNGSELLEFDRATQTCLIQELPPDMRGQKIFQSPLPFVFNLDAKEIQNRYWVREVAPPASKQNTYLLEAWPKSQEDRAQYRFVQISIDAETFLPQALILYAPNFDPINSPMFDHYEFTGVKRNGIISNLQQHMDIFVNAKPPKDWKIIRETFGVQKQAQAPDGQQLQQR